MIKFQKCIKMIGRSCRRKRLSRLPSNIWREKSQNSIKFVRQGVPIKMRLGFCSIALSILIQQGSDYILLKTGIHSFVLNTETFLSDIWKPRYRFPKFQFQNWQCNFLSQCLGSSHSKNLVYTGLMTIEQMFNLQMVKSCFKKCKRVTTRNFNVQTYYFKQ